jgi:hypothetical protein
MRMEDFRNMPGSFTAFPQNEWDDLQTIAFPEQVDTDCRKRKARIEKPGAPI